MTVGELRRLLEEIPDDTPIVVTDRDSPDFFHGCGASAALLSLYRMPTGEYFDAEHIARDPEDVPVDVFCIEEA